MKALSGWTISVGLLLAATAAHAQGASPQGANRPLYQTASDIEGPYADAPPPPRVIYGAPAYREPNYDAPGYGPGDHAGPPLLPPREVYAVLRENGFSPLGAPRLRGLYYSVSAIDRRGDDGRLVIDARDGRIVRFVPADRFSGYGGYGDDYGPPPRSSYGALEPMSRLDAPPRPPAAVQPKIAARMPPTVPVPKAAPARPAGQAPVALKSAPAPTSPSPVQQSAAAQIKPGEAPAAPAEAKPAAPVIQPTQPMPKVQDFE